MSKTMVVSPIVAALVKTEDILGKDRKWNVVNDVQAHFLEQFFSKREELRGFSEKELRSWASWVAAELNEILEKEGFDIRLQDFAPNEFGVVSILDVLVEWLVEGEKTRLYIDDANYPAVKMEPEAEVEGGFKTIFEVYTSSQHPYPVAMLHTKSGDRLYMTIADRPYQDFKLISRIDEIRNDLQRDQYYDWLMFPMVDLNHEVDISWLKNMQTTVEGSGEEAIISDALQQTKFKMNELGARVKSAVAIKVTITSVRREMGLIIDKPFFLWIEREGMLIPVMYAHIDEGDWKNPGNLDM